jgi:hypothetical protein
MEYRVALDLIRLIRDIMRVTGFWFLCRKEAVQRLVKKKNSQAAISHPGIVEVESIEAHWLHHSVPALWE